LDPVAFRNLVDEVKERTDVVELIGRDIELRSSGSHFVGHSPWNRDTTPSLVVWPDSQRWMDYSGGGNGGGDCINYLQRREGIDFMEALRELAARAGVAVPNGSSGDAVEAARAMIERRRIEDLHAIAATYYHSGFPTKIRQVWLHGRYGFTDETIDRLLLGWADGHLLDHLIETAGASTEEALSTGLFVRTRGGRVVDLFCNRIVFPYWHRGRACYFIARQTEHTDDKPWEQAKYKKLLTRSEKHPYVSKHVQNDTFYGEDSIRGAEEIVVTEGVTDAIAVLQCGLAVLSPVTVRFRKRDHAKLIALTKHARRVVICNDSEKSGAGEAGSV
jgi:DNA primase